MINWVKELLSWTNYVGVQKHKFLNVSSLFTTHHVENIQISSRMAAALGTLQSSYGHTATTNSRMRMLAYATDVEAALCGGADG